MSEYSTGQEGPAYPSPTPTEKGVWDLQQVRDKQLLGTGQWKYDAPSAPSGLFTTGSNRDGVLGGNFGPQFARRSSPIQIGTQTDWSKVFVGSEKAGAIKTDGTMWTFGNNYQGTLGQNNTIYYSSPVQIPGTTWSDASMSYSNVLATKTDGTLWGWGNNTVGNLGQNNRTHRSSPVQIPGTDWNIVQVIGGGSAGMAIKVI